MVFKEGAGIVILLLFIGFASASFEVGKNASHSILTQYAPSEKISGWINISFKNEYSNSSVSDSEGNSISLIDLIRQNEEFENFEYSCNTNNCISDYATEGTGTTSISDSLVSGQKKLIGIKLNGKISSISSLNLTITSNAAPSCDSQLKIDILKDNSTEFINDKASEGTSCASKLSRGCFNPSKSSEQYTIEKFSTGKHCQKITLPSSPGFKLGMWINNQTNDARNITMALYDSNMDEITGMKCKLPPVVGSGNASCNINYSVKEPTSYFVCAYSDKTGSSELRGYGDETNGCGFYHESETNPELSAAFDIFAQGLAFSSLNEIKIADSSEDITNNIKDYIYSRYESYDCSKNNCIVPILIESKSTQDITLKDLKLVYTTNLGGTTADKLYSIKEIPPKINASFQKLFLDYGNFSAPSQYGNKTFKIKINEGNVFSQVIQVKNFPKIISIFPTTAPALISTTFTVSASPSKNITEYVWNFNDSTPVQTTLTNKTTHTFSDSGTYKINIEVKNSEGLKSSKTFEILATIPKEQIGSELEKKLKNLESVKTQINQFDKVTKDGLNSVLDMTELEKELKNLQREYGFLTSASEEEDYARILTNLSSMQIPERIEITKKSSLLVFYPMENQIDLETLKSVGGGNYSSAQSGAYQEAVLGWQIGNVEMKVSMEEISAMIKGEEEPLLIKFVMNVKKTYSEKPVYLFLKKMEDLKFKENYFAKEKGDYYYWMMEEDTKEITFTTSEIINYDELPAFVSPEISTLSVQEKEIPPVIKKMRWDLISISIAALLVAAMIVYSFLSVWYKRRYESYLFKNRNDLYNLIHYVNVSKKKGETEESMRTHLKKAGWTGEQITYVLKKYSGKRTGMIELPLTKLIDKLMGSAEPQKHPQQQPHQGAGHMRRPF